MARTIMTRKMKCNICGDGVMAEHYMQNPKMLVGKRDDMWQDGTRIYVCDKCPNIQFEFVERTDLKNLTQFLGYHYKGGKK